MSPTPSSLWARAVTDRQLVGATGAAIVILAVASLVVWHAFPGDRRTTTEANVYFAFADRVARGAVPYRDVTIEYPPGAIPVFLAPVWLLGSTKGAEWDDAAKNDAARRYESSLAVLLFAMLAATLVVVALTLRLLQPTVGHAARALALPALSPVLLGALPLTRYDAWPVLITSLGLLAAVAARVKLAGAVLGLAATAKLYPLVMLPTIGVRAWRTGGPRRLAALLLACAVAAAVVIVPFFALAPGETARAIKLQLARGLQMESLGGSLLAAAWKATLSLDAHGVLPGSLPVEACQRCDGIVAAQLTGTLAAIVGLVALVVVLVVLERSARRVHRMADERSATVWGAAVAVTALVAVGKVLSAQFVLWLLPLVPLVRGRRGRDASVLLAVAALMTNVWFPSLYRDYVNYLTPGSITFLLARNALLVAVLVVLLLPPRDDDERSPERADAGPDPTPADA